MFYHSLILVFLVALTSQIPVAMKTRCAFGAMYFGWAFLWFFGLSFWHIAISHPPAVIPVFLFLFIAIAAARAYKLRSRWFSVWSACCVVLAYGLSIWTFIPVYHEHQRILAQHPPVDLKPRLAYERPIQPPTDQGLPEKPNNETVVAARSAPITESPRFDSKLLQDQSQAFNSSIGYFEHKRIKTFAALSKIHDGFVEDFIEQPALGVGRLPAIRPLREFDVTAAKENDERQPDVLIDQPSGPISDAEMASQNAENREPANDVQPVAADAPVPAVESAPSQKMLQEYHLDRVVGFAPQESLGAVDEGLAARGFKPHALRSLPSPHFGKPKPDDWKMTRLELVSLLKHQPPAVYVSEHLPAMDELRDAPTRPTTKFEDDAIAKLRAGEELVVETSSQTARMVGSIRAIAECRKCHQVPLGGLLGAFSYRLAPGKMPKPQPPKVIKGEAQFSGSKEISVAEIGN